MDLGSELNTYYEKEHFSLHKNKPYFKTCTICNQPISNDSLTLKWHMEWHKNHPEGSQKLAP
jgi:hypothetical protein